LKEIGSGQNAYVALAYDKETKKAVALKLMKNIDEDAKKEVQNEIAALLNV